MTTQSQPRAAGESAQPAAAVAGHTPTADGRLYDLAVIRTDTSQKKLTGYPMTHAECCVMKSKFSAEEQARIIFVPARPKADPYHGPQSNHEAELIREIAFLKEKLLVAQSAQETIWKANIDLANQARKDDYSKIALASSVERLERENKALREAVELAETMAANLRGDFIEGRTIHREECAKNLLLFTEKMRAALAQSQSATATNS